MIPYTDEMEAQEREDLQRAIRLLMNQTYVLERKYDRKSKRMQLNHEFRVCDQHLEFLKEYFALAGFTVREELTDGIIWLLPEEGQAGPRLSEYTTKFLLMLKVIYDEQMASASTSSYVVTTRAQVQEKMDSFKLLSRQPPAAEVRSTVRILKKYQMIDFIDSGEELEPDARFLIYPTINMLLMGEEIQRVAKAYANEEGEDDDSTI
ncbi:DUF4194 domain-containing protein [Lacrimispora saccharolytica]|nr:DUF4194 domain-containing protein [Lacrimispora saccharolytica]